MMSILLPTMSGPVSSARQSLPGELRYGASISSATPSGMIVGSTATV